MTVAERDVSGEGKRSAKRAHLTGQRLQLAERFRREGADDLASQLEACESTLKLTCVCCGEQKEATTHCNKRWCPVCAPLVAARRCTRWMHAIEQLEWPLFVTLTIPNSEDPETLRELRGHWSKFRRRKIWKERVKGGVGAFEVTNKGNGWHPHIHSVIDCEWLSIHVPPPQKWESRAVKKQKYELAQKELSRAWAEQIGSEHGIVWVRRVYGVGVVKEVLKYSVKGDELLGSPEPVVPLVRVLQKTRTLSGFGSLHPLPSPENEEEFSVECEECGSTKCFVPNQVLEYIIRKR